MSRCILILVQSSILSWKVMKTCDKPKKLVWSVSSVSENRIHLLHQTTREFLVQKGFADANNQTQPITEVESHSVLAISCIASIHSISGMLSSNIDPYALTSSEETSSNESQRFLVYPSQIGSAMCMMHARRKNRAWCWKLSTFAIQTPMFSLHGPTYTT